MAAIEGGKREMTTIVAENRIKQALRSKLSPATSYDTKPGDEVLLYREDEKARLGPYRVLRTREKYVFVDRKESEKHFNLSQVIPAPRAPGDREVKPVLDGMQQFKENYPPGILVIEVTHPADRRGRSQLPNEVKASEFAGLAERSAYKIVLKEDVRKGANILGGRLVLAIKNADAEDEVYKARFVLQRNTDIEKNTLVHNSTSLRQGSISVLLALAALFSFRLWSHDVSQTSLQSAEKLMTNVYVKATEEFSLFLDVLLKLLKPLYGLSDSGDYWHETFSSHFVEELAMKPTCGDLSLFFKTVEEKLKGISGAYVDDTVGTGDVDSEKESGSTRERFQSKARETDNFQLTGIQIEKTADGNLMH